MKPLWKYLIEAWREWIKDRNRTSAQFCPLCNYELSSDDTSFQKDDGTYWHYKCVRCGCESTWSFHMLPYPIKWQHLNEEQTMPIGLQYEAKETL